jgi:hypothetical protein
MHLLYDIHKRACLSWFFFCQIDRVRFLQVLGAAMNQPQALSTVKEIMTAFARGTGLSPAGEHPRRYLWTDAFAVCNFLELYRQTGDEKYKKLALLLVDQVHNVLGCHREDDPRHGWISGLDEHEGKKHPTKSGLRIGKKMNERGISDPFDERIEWDRDGQYYHYLTKWMHALNRVSRVTGDPTYNIWAMELAEAAHARFTYVPASGGQKYMYWKMSIDLSRPLVQSMGQHDPLDGFITYNQLQMFVPEGSKKKQYPDLEEEITDMGSICKGRSWVTDDPLGIGGLLCDSYRAAQMIVSGYFKETDLLETMLGSALLGLEPFERMNPLQLPVEYRLAFRELGLSIGMRAIRKLYGLVEEGPDMFKKSSSVQRCIEMLIHFTPLIEMIESFWLDKANQEAENWRDHRDINMVMLATSLAPDGFLVITPST